MVKKFIIIVLFLFVLFSLYRIYERSNRIKHLQDVKQHMLQELEEKKKEIAKIKKKMNLPIDEETLKKKAYEQLHFSKGNETLVIFKDE
ncbi:MAG: hypothetical protein J7J73_02185 [Deltaproteobacteria bacterium]|nr:hypothetical protein [Deltaproteobacteria bacterium]